MNFVPNKAHSLDGATASAFHFQPHWRAASDAQR
jgi:hypothetical protein